jgi:hypothetical protein
MTAPSKLGKRSGTGKARKIVNLCGDLRTGEPLAIVTVVTTSETDAVIGNQHGN